jgi:hypothetical protein
MWTEVTAEIYLRRKRVPPTDQTLQSGVVFNSLTYVCTCKNWSSNLVTKNPNLPKLKSSPFA